MVSSIRAGGICVRVGGNCLKYLKRGWNRTEGRRQKDFKKGGRLGQGVGALKMVGGGGLELPYKLWFTEPNFTVAFLLIRLVAFLHFLQPCMFFTNAYRIPALNRYLKAPKWKPPYLKGILTCFTGKFPKIFWVAIFSKC